MSKYEEEVWLEQQLAEFKHGHEVAELKAMFAELDRVATHNYAIKDAEIAELREQLANALAANEHNLKVYHAAAAELRQQLAERDAELEAERQRRWEGNRISSAELAASQKQVDALLNVVQEANKYIDQTYSDNLGRNCEWLAARYADSLSPMLLKAIAATEPKP